MTTFDWIAFFQSHNIRYVTTGPNVSAGRAAVPCPFCGPDDPSEHLVVNLRGSNWWCWRKRAEHKGATPEWLIQNLIHCTFDQARIMVGGVPLTEDFLNQVQAHFSEPDTEELKQRKVVMPESFKCLSDKPSARPYIQYLEGRGFERQRILQKFSRKYGLRYCTSGAYAGRVIFPVRYDHKLIAWTGRTLSKRDELRYKALTTDPERAEWEGVNPAAGVISHHLLWFDSMMQTQAETIVLCEGPFDSLKIRELGRKYGITSTCFFTTTPTNPQVNLLHELLPRFKRRYILLDPEMIAVAMSIAQQLSSLNVEVMQVPNGVEDPGALNNLRFLFM